MIRSLLCLSLLTGIFLTTTAQSVTLPPSGDNQRASVTQYIGALVHVTVDYSSPDVTGPNGQDRSGQIWGQLVPYGLNDLGFGLRSPAPWRAGANENTTITFSHDVLIQGQPLAAGIYGFHVVVAEEGPWTLLFSHNHRAWGSYFYDPTEDALRVEATPVTNEHREWLTYEFVDRQAEEATLALMWEKVMLPFTISVPNMTELYLANMRSELQNAPGFSWQSWNQAAMYCVQHNTNLEEALTWAETSISTPFVGQENFTTLSGKFMVLEALRRNEEAKAVMEQAVAHPTADAAQVHQLGRQMIGMGKYELALAVFTANYERYEGAWPTPVGMARGLSAMGKYQEAAKHMEAAIEAAPTGDGQNYQYLQQLLETLRAGKAI